MLETFGSTLDVTATTIQTNSARNILHSTETTATLTAVDITDPTVTEEVMVTSGQTLTMTGGSITNAQGVGILRSSSTVATFTNVPMATPTLSGDAFQTLNN